MFEEDANNFGGSKEDESTPSIDSEFGVPIMVTQRAKKALQNKLPTFDNLLKRRIPLLGLDAMNTWLTIMPS